MPVLFFSLEMSHAELTQRLLCSEARVDSSRIRNGKLPEADWPKISHAIGRLGEAPLYIDDNPNLTVMEIRAKARRLKSRLGDLGPDRRRLPPAHDRAAAAPRTARSRCPRSAGASRSWPASSRCPVVALSQLSRNLEMRADKRPMLADLRESGSLEQDADVVMFLYRDEIYNPESPDRGTAEVIVSKHRNGPTGKTAAGLPRPLHPVRQHGPHMRPGCPSHRHPDGFRSRRWAGRPPGPAAGPPHRPSRAGPGRGPASRPARVETATWRLQAPPAGR